MSVAGWKIGDKVLCVDAKKIRDEWSQSLLKAGEEYIISDIHRCKMTTLCVGLPLPDLFDKAECVGCARVTDKSYHYAWRFIKLDPWLTQKDLDLQLQEDLEHARRIIQPQYILADRYTK